MKLNQCYGGHRNSQNEHILLENGASLGELGFSKLEGGMQHYVFCGRWNSRKVVLKLFRGCPLERLVRQVKIQSAVHQALKIAPQVLAIDGQFILQARETDRKSSLNGFAMEYVANDRPGIAQGARSLGTCLRHLHRHRFDGSIDLIELSPPLNSIERWRYVGPEVKALHSTLLELGTFSSLRHPVLIHGDVSGSNLRQQNNETLLLDWESSYFGSPEHDIGKAGITLRPGSKDFVLKVREFIEGYGSRSLTPRSIMLCAIAELISIYAWRLKEINTLADDEDWPMVWASECLKPALRLFEYLGDDKRLDSYRNKIKELYYIY